MNNYSNYTVIDFVRDEFFQDWIMRPDQATNSFWEHWLRTHPEKTACVKEAENIILNIKFPFYQLSENEREELWCRIKKFEV
jgi:transmembrane sensor